MKRYISLFILGVFLFSYKLFSLEIDPALLSELTGCSNSGTEFYMTFHPGWDSNKDTNKIKIFISSKYATQVVVKIPGINFKQTKTTIPNEVIEFNLKPEEAQQYTKTDQVKPFPERIWKNKAIKITSDEPIICYGVRKLYSSAEGYFVMPVNVLGTEYQVASYKDASDNQKQWSPAYTSVMLIR